MKLENIGFYTLSDKRAKESNENSPMYRCEMILTDRCNFKCPYCRGLRNDCLGDMNIDSAKFVLDRWIEDGLKNVRFSGGEPTLYKGLDELVRICKDGGVEHIAISTNGSADRELYKELLFYGVNDFSISLDACCSSGVDTMSGVSGMFDIISENIRFLSSKTYVTVGVVLTDDNMGDVVSIIEYAHGLGVSDIRIISAAQYNAPIVLDISSFILDAHPILKYRVENMKNGIHVRGLKECDSKRCYLIEDDSVVCGGYHFPCVIYMREQGEPIGKIGFDMRKERVEWGRTHDVYNDPICRKNCLDVCIDYNNKCNKLKGKL